jgi:hypothetical protein
MNPARVRVLDRLSLLFGERVPLRRPLQSEKKFLDAVSVKQIMQGYVPKHDEDGVVTVLSMLGSARPYLCRKRPKLRHKCLAIDDVSLQGTVQIHLQKHIIGFVAPRIIRGDDRAGIRKNLTESI